MVTIRDVAQKANVSISTVSHVLNGTRFVSEETKKAVLTAIKELGYRPNPIARGLKTDVMKTIGVIVSDVINPFFTSVVRGIEDGASEAGYSVIVCNSDEIPKKQDNYLHVLEENRVAGIIITPVAKRQGYLRTLINERRFPIVIVNREIPQLKVDSVIVDNRGGAYEAIKHLLDHGHRRIGVVAGLANSPTTIRRLEGYKVAIAEKGISFDEALVIDGHATFEGGRLAAHALMELKPRPTAIFSMNALMTAGVMLALQEKGAECPRDVSVISFSDSFWAAGYNPPITAMAQPTYEMGREAVRLLLERINEINSEEPRRVIFPATLVVRKSVRRCD